MEKTIIQPNITLFKPPKQRFGGCYGLVIETGKSEKILIDCNFPGELMDPFLHLINNEVQYYFVTHFHMDHTAHVHLIEEKTSATIFMPKQESHIITDLNNLIEFAGIDKAGLADVWRTFGYKILKFKECKSVEAFTPGTKFQFDDITISTLHLPGHSPGHTGFIISDFSDKEEKILHVADLGLDPFGPWYGFEKICSLPDYFNSIEKVEKLLKDCRYLLSSHTDIFTENFTSIINNVRLKILKREDLILNAIKSSRSPLTLDQLNALELIFPINKFAPPERFLYQFWSKNFLIHHLSRLIAQKKICYVNNAYSIA